MYSINLPHRPIDKHRIIPDILIRLKHTYMKNKANDNGNGLVISIKGLPNKCYILYKPEYDGYIIIDKKECLYDAGCLEDMLKIVLFKYKGMDCRLEPIDNMTIEE